jgi:hypothetical protein
MLDRHARAGGHPKFSTLAKNWIPAFAGMTLLLCGASPAAIAAAASPEPPPRETPAEEAAPASAVPDPQSGDSFDFFSDKPVDSAEVVALPAEKSAWITVGGPIALLLFFFVLDLLIWWLVPFSEGSIELNLRDLPPAVKRGIAMAVVMFGIAFCFGASEIAYQLKLHGSAEAYFAQMSLGKLIAFTHAHLFGFTTSFFIVGVPFSLQFNHIRLYQWVFPVGLAASVTDVVSWWGIKFLSPNFEWVSMFCGLLFGVSYLWMLIGLLRVLLFPEVIWASDKDRDVRLEERRALDDAAKYKEGDL